MKPFDPDDPWIMYASLAKLWPMLIKRATR